MIQQAEMIYEASEQSPMCGDRQMRKRRKGEKSRKREEKKKSKEEDEEKEKKQKKYLIAYNMHNMGRFSKDFFSLAGCHFSPRRSVVIFFNPTTQTGTMYRFYHIY